VVDKLRIEIESLLADKKTCKEMESALKAASRPDASIRIVDEIEKLLNK
jgi:UDP-N-acetylglucosamine:LPS N-acetylglucosamine transferase